MTGLVLNGLVLVLGLISSPVNAQQIPKPYLNGLSAASEIEKIALQSLQTIRQILSKAGADLIVRINQNGAVIQNLFGIFGVAGDIPWVVTIADRLDDDFVQFAITLVRNAEKQIGDSVIGALIAFQGIVAPFEMGCQTIGRNSWKLLRMILRQSFDEVYELVGNSSSKYLSQNHKTGSEVNALNRIAVWQTDEDELKRLQAELIRTISDSGSRQRRDNDVIQEKLVRIVKRGLNTFQNVAANIAGRLRSIAIK